jgi:hypothetical protein
MARTKVEEKTEVKALVPPVFLSLPPGDTGSEGCEGEIKKAESGEYRAKSKKQIPLTFEDAHAFPSPHGERVG